MEVPFAEIVLITRHVKMAELHTWLNRVKLDDIHSLTTPAPKSPEKTGLSSQRFKAEVVATRNSDTRRVVAEGRDSTHFWRFACEGVERLLAGNFIGAGASRQEWSSKPKSFYRL